MENLIVLNVILKGFHVRGVEKSSFAGIIAGDMEKMREMGEMKLSRYYSKQNMRLGLIPAYFI